MIVGEGIDPGEALGDEFALQPEALATLHHIDLGKRAAMAIGLGAAVTELDLRARGKLGQSRLRLGDERPGPVTARAEWCGRRLGIDQPYERAVGQRQSLSPSLTSTTVPRVARRGRHEVRFNAMKSPLPLRYQLHDMRRRDRRRRTALTMPSNAAATRATCRSSLLSRRSWRRSQFIVAVNVCRW